MTGVMLMPSNISDQTPDQQVRLSGPAERIRCAVARRRPTVAPRGIDAAAVALAAMHEQAHGSMAHLGARSERVTQYELNGDRPVTLEDLADWLHRDGRSQQVALAGLRALLASVAWEARPVSFGLASLTETTARLAEACGVFVAWFTRAASDGQVDAHEAAQGAPLAEQVAVYGSVDHTSLLRLAGGDR